MHDSFILLGGLIMGFVGAVVGWFVSNRYGKPLVSVWELRKNVQQALSRSRSLGKLEGGRRLGDLAADADAIHKTLPYPLSIFCE